MLFSAIPKFVLGEVVQTRGIFESRKSNKQFDRDVLSAFQRYTKADWSDMEFEEDKEQNEEAIKTGTTRIFATYNTCLGQIYIITEWDRSYTTILFPSEY